MLRFLIEATFLVVTGFLAYKAYERYVEMNEDYDLLERKYKKLKEKLAGMLPSAKRLTDENSMLTAQIQRLKKEIASFEDEIKKNRTPASGSNKLPDISITEEIKKCYKTIEKLKADIRSRDGSIKSLSTLISNLESDRVGLQTSIHNASFDRNYKIKLSPEGSEKIKEIDNKIKGMTKDIMQYSLIREMKPVAILALSYVKSVFQKAYETADHKNVDSKISMFLKEVASTEAKCESISLKFNGKYIDLCKQKLTIIASEVALHEENKWMAAEERSAMLEEKRMAKEIEQAEAAKRKAEEAERKMQLEFEKARQAEEEERRRQEALERELEARIAAATMQERSKLQAELDRIHKDAEEKHAQKEQEIEKLRKKLEDAHAESVMAAALATHTKTGFVYIIKNPRSFGPDIVKIGMTRREAPETRIKELSGASVPFSFDPVTIVYSSNAPELENALHRSFDAQRVNTENLRKEFFRVLPEVASQKLFEIDPKAIPITDQERWNAALDERARMISKTQSAKIDSYDVDADEEE